MCVRDIQVEENKTKQNKTGAKHEDKEIEE
jgi:hypothetical protein